MSEPDDTGYLSALLVQMYLIGSMDVGVASFRCLRYSSGICAKLVVLAAAVGFTSSAPVVALGDQDVELRVRVAVVLVGTAGAALG